MRTSGGTKARQVCGVRTSALTLRDKQFELSSCKFHGQTAIRHAGEVAEWSKAHAWKVCRRETVSRVRIPLSPPFVNS